LDFPGSSTFPVENSGADKALLIDLDKIKQPSSKIEKIQKQAHEDLLSGGSSLDKVNAKLDAQRKSKSDLLSQPPQESIRSSKHRYLQQHRPQYQIVAMTSSQDKGRTLSHQFHNQANPAAPSNRGKIRKKVHQRKNSIQK
jgi:hypothetical protein